MKDVKFEVCFVTACLANDTGPDGERDVFQRDTENCLIFQQAAWYSAFAQAIEMAHIRGIKPADIHMNLSVKARTEIYDRRYSETRSRRHEAIMPGTHVVFEAVVADHVTHSSLTAILSKMGKYVGYSSYGHRLGFGKFTLVNVDVAASEYIDNGDTRESDNAKAST